MRAQARDRASRGSRCAGPPHDPRDGRGSVPPSEEVSMEGTIATPLLLQSALAAAAAIDSGSTAWMLTSSALVLLMIPGLALFYGGMVRRKNILTTMMQSFVAMSVIGVQWVLVGYALAFGRSQHGLIG